MIEDVRVEKIKGPGWSLRRRELDVADLAESIKVKGLIQPVLLRPAEDGLFEVVHGSRRLEAFRKLGYPRILAIVRPLKDESAFEIGLIENLQRQDLHPWDEALAFKEYMDKFGVSYQELAERIGKSTDYVFARVHIAERVKVPNLYALSFTELRELSRVPEPKAQRVLVQEVHKQGLTTDELHERVQEVKGTAAKERRIGRFRCRLCGGSLSVFHVEKSGVVSHRVEKGARK